MQGQRGLAPGLVNGRSKEGGGVWDPNPRKEGRCLGDPHKKARKKARPKGH